VQEKCRVEEPPLIPAATPGHEFRCWFPVGTPEGRAALERNRAGGIAPAPVPTGSPPTNGGGAASTARDAAEPTDGR
jgi:peptide/nickel transport system ATP-binding protein